MKAFTSSNGSLLIFLNEDADLLALHEQDKARKQAWRLANPPKGTKINKAGETVPKNRKRLEGRSVVAFLGEMLRGENNEYTSHM